MRTVAIHVKINDKAEVIKYPEWNVSRIPKNAVLETILRGRTYSSGDLSDEPVTSKIINAAFKESIDMAIAYDKTTEFRVDLNQEKNF